MAAFVKRVAMERVKGKRASPLRAVAAATATGAAVAVVTYRLLRG